MKKGLVMLMAAAMVFAFASAALAAVEPTIYTSENPETLGRESVHLDGTWNSPYTVGIDGYNYNDAQDYTADTNPTNQVEGKYTSGPHGGYLTSTHKCRECHAVHRAAGKFKLTRSDTRFEACDWCHGTGAGSGFNIQMDNDDAYTTEYNVGHSMGFGISTGKWKAPDDTYPAFTPKFVGGGFSCFDCHSPHANPQRLLGYNDAGEPVGLPGSAANQAGKTYGIANAGHDLMKGDGTDNYLMGGTTPKPVYLSGSWLLIKNPDREIATVAETGARIYTLGTTPGAPGSFSTIDIAQNQEISDLIGAYVEVINGERVVTAGALQQFKAGDPYPVNKVMTDWNSPIGAAYRTDDPSMGDTTRSDNPVWMVAEFCTDCHDGNAGLSVVKAPLFSEDRALRNQGNDPVTGEAINDFRDNYDLAYGHDSAPRH